MDTTEKKEIKIVRIPNLNNKMHCPFFTHISLPPIGSMTDGELPKSILVEDSLGNLGSFPAKLITLARCSVGSLSSIDTYPATGLDREAFLEKFYKENPTAHHHTGVAVYVYERVIS